MRTTTLPPWLFERKIFCGRDGEKKTDEKKTGEGEGGNNEGEGNADEEGDGDGDSGVEDKDTYTKDDVAGLRSALDKERKANKTSAKELKELRKIKAAKDEEELKKKGDAEREKARAEKAEGKLDKLAPALKRREIRDAILAEARKLGFIDETDALSVMDEEAMAEQDEDDPSNIEVDTKAVASAVKKLANDKKHLVAKSTESGEKTGTKFNRRNDGGGEGESMDDKVKSLYRI